MKYVVKKYEAKIIRENNVSTFYEYNLPFKNASVGVSEINGRYPETGFDIDEQVEGSWYVESGKGIVWVSGQEYTVEQGDVILIPANEKFYIVGENLRLVVASSPLWFSEQHKHLE